MGGGTTAIPDCMAGTREDKESARVGQVYTNFFLNDGRNEILVGAQVDDEGAPQTFPASPPSVTDAATRSEWTHTDRS